jgi:hypothetical protein
MLLVTKLFPKYFPQNWFLTKRIIPFFFQIVYLLTKETKIKTNLKVKLD